MHGRFVAAALTIMLVLLGSACTMHDGGYMPMAAGTWSPMTFQSTAAAPKTVAIVDTRTGETVFEVDIPTGQQLSIEFFMNKHRHKKPEAPDYMKYTLHTLGDVIGHLDKRVDVPAPWNRRVDVFLRSLEAYTPPDPSREVKPLDVPLPEAAVKPNLQTDVPAGDDASTQAETDQPAATPAPQSTEPEKPTETHAVEVVEPEKSAETPVVEPEKTVATPAIEPVKSDEPTETPEPKKPAESLAANTIEADTSVSTAPISTMTWTDTGHTRRVWVTDIRSGNRVFEVDVPKGSDLILHFFDMWIPKGSDKDVQSMHWEIVKSGGHVTVPAHHATVPSEPFRRISEEGVDPHRESPPPPTATEETPKVDESGEDKPPPPVEPPPAEPPPIDLLDDADDGQEAESKPDVPSPA